MDEIVARHYIEEVADRIGLAYVLDVAAELLAEHEARADHAAVLAYLGWRGEE